jgi:hypothetical protein
MSLSTLRIALISAFALSVLAKGVPFSQTNSTSHGQTIFYSSFPSQEQIDAFQTGIFNSIVTVPSSYYECPPSAHSSFIPPSFTCHTTEPQTPESIYLASAGHPMPECRRVGGAGVIFEQFQWATWTHSCWAYPNPAIDTPEGHTELSFQSRAIHLRNVVLYQHDVHLVTLNRQIQEMAIAKEAQQLAMNQERATRLQNIDQWLEREMAKLPKYGRHAKLKAQNFEKQREEKRKAVVEEADAAVAEIETRFWRDTFDIRVQAVELGHLVGEYWDGYMKGWAEGDWNGMGQVGFPSGKEFTVPPPA